MSHCVHFRREIALLLSEPGRPEFPPQLQEHIQRCTGCRNYCTEVEALCALCSTYAETIGNRSRTPRFHQAWLEEIDREQSRVPEFCAQKWLLRIVLPVVLALLGAIAVFYRSNRTPPDSRKLAVSAVPQDSTTTLLDYRLASDSELERLLQLEPKGSSSPKQTYSMLTRTEDEIGE